MLSDYLKKRGLQLEPLKIGENRGITEKELGLIGTISEEALLALLQPRVHSIMDELVVKAEPEEVLVLRQAIVEVGGIIDDYRAYKKEIERRKEIKETPQEPQPQTSPPEEVGGAL